MSARAASAISRWPKVEVKKPSALAGHFKSSPSEVVFAVTELRLGTPCREMARKKPCCELQHQRVGEMPQHIEIANILKLSAFSNSLNENGLGAWCDGRGLALVVLSQGTVPRVHLLAFGLARREDAKQ